MSQGTTEMATGQRILITGAASGVGFAIARKCLETGDCVGFHYRAPSDEIKVKIELLGQASGRVVPLEGDLLDAGDRDSLVSKFTEVSGGIDVLINNAGAVKDYSHFRDLPISSWEETININATAPFALCRAAWPHFEAQGYGRIVNISSAAVGYGGGPNGVHYVAAKAALESLTTSLAKAGAGQNILVNTVRCGVIDTPMHKKIDGYDEAEFFDRVRRIPVGRLGTPEEVAELVSFLISDHGAFITGETISISGGEL